ncbi:MAG: glycosyl hydrolase, partial [Rubripirellula sp.]
MPEATGKLISKLAREVAGFLASFKYVRKMYDEMGVDNVCYVWQSCGFMSSMEDLEAWYPGDEYVDWCGYSFFGNYKSAKMIPFARKHGKPVFIAEATPTVNVPGRNDGTTFEMDLGN